MLKFLINYFSFESVKYYFITLSNFSIINNNAIFINQKKTYVFVEYKNKSKF